MARDSISKPVLTALRTELSIPQLKSKGSTFVREMASGNSLLLGFQKSVKSSPEEELITVNYGVYSRRIGRQLGDADSARFDVMQAHWRRRIMENGRERWITVTPNDVAHGIQELVSLAKSAMAELELRQSDEALRDEWLSDSSPGLTDAQRLYYLAILLKELGPSEKLADVVNVAHQRFDGTSLEGVIRRQLSSLGLSYA